MQYIKEITVDLSGEMYFNYITAVQGDENSRFVKITILSGGTTFTPPAGATAVLRCRKPDGTFVFNDAEINNDGTITAELSENMLAAIGNCRCEVTIYDDGSSLTTVPFIVKVTAGAVDPDVESTDEYTALTAALGRVDDVSGVASAALEDATAAYNKMAEVEADIDAHTSAANAATERANTAAEQAEAVVEQASQLVTRYGVKFEGSANTGATVKRLYNAVGLVAGVGTDAATAVNDFDNVYPWSHIRRACGYWGDDGNFVVNAYKGEPGYATDGSNGEVWVEIPVFYFKHEYDGDAEQIEISATRLSGYMPSPIHVDDDGVIHDKAYIAAYNMALVDNKPTSRSGVFSTIHSVNTAMTDARKAGADFTCSTTAERYTMSLLMFVEFATRNMQNVMQGAASMPYVATDTATAAGTATNQFTTTEAIAAKFVVGQSVGIGTSLGGTQVANNRVITDISGGVITFDGDPVNIAVGNIIWTTAWKNGACDGVLSSSGSPVSNSNGKYPCMYRGIENPYGNAFEQIADVLFKREGAGTEEDPYTYDIYFLPDARKYAAGAITGDYVKLNYQIPAADGYAKKFGIDARYPFARLPVSIGASTTTYYSDYYYAPRSALCAALVGGYWTLGSDDGPSAWTCNPAPSYSAVFFRARLSKHRKSGGTGAA